jgi:hypothetical protein
MPGNYRASGALTPRHATVGRLVSGGHNLNCGTGTVVALRTRRRSCCGRSTQAEKYEGVPTVRLTDNDPI